MQKEIIGIPNMVRQTKLFDAAHKFDYIETVIYIVGATTDSRIQAPVRIIRYSGT